MLKKKTQRLEVEVGNACSVNTAGDLSVRTSLAWLKKKIKSSLPPCKEEQKELSF